MTIATGVSANRQGMRPAQAWALAKKKAGHPAFFRF
jgi:hypothetical protein